MDFVIRRYLTVGDLLAHPTTVSLVVGKVELIIILAKSSCILLVNVGVEVGRDRVLDDLHDWGFLVVDAEGDCELSLVYVAHSRRW